MAAEAVKSKIEFGPFGPAYLTGYKCLGDGASGEFVTHGYADANVLAVWCCEINDGAAQTVTNAAGVATLGTTITAGQYVMLFVLHK
jgi:hypothetical protein